jgi:hypothetical protein
LLFDLSIASSFNTSPARTFGFRHSVAKEPLRFQEKLESLQAACDTESRR